LYLKKGASAPFFVSLNLPNLPRHCHRRGVGNVSTFSDIQVVFYLLSDLTWSVEHFIICKPDYFVTKLAVIYPGFWTPPQLSPVWRESASPDVAGLLTSFKLSVVGSELVSVIITDLLVSKSIPEYFGSQLHSQ